MRTIRWLSLLLIVVAVFALAGCTAVAPAAEPAAGEEGVTMTFITRDSNQAIVRQLVDAWNESHTNQIEVTVVPADQFVTKFGTMIASGTPPDIVAVDLIYVPAFAAAGQMTDITDMAQALPYFDTLSPSHIRLGTYEDQALRRAVQRQFRLIWNKDLFSQAGLDPGSRKQTGRRSTSTPRRSPRWATASMGTISPAPAGATRLLCPDDLGQRRRYPV